MNSNTEVKQKIEQLLEPLLENDKFFIVDIKVSLSKVHSKVTILLDSDEGIKIDECTAISRQLGTDIDEMMPEKYTLEVSSPGVDFPLKSERMYRKNIGRNLKVVFKDGKEVKGSLEAVDLAQITLIEDKKRKKNEEIIPIQIPFDNIKESQVIISFK
ncbi:Ribosome maturation factor rimP [Emticicia oligotrophica DSM 17448]|uniref:Ribosome maturation factor RimP n=1 Tax=Emticicia oligotrophica (strain DSM 17448 / CIP 109782 / MTCC 6937 / GPTSA100-15) TaxID=929562 RepID=A0ABN4ADJ6_EMTOG|nr:ribosome maturation factor RimP [Emticicia oligotrophica]AFK01510.1 Ribosome maturation factor rimP [Emticicia oligotrophica DSM 17448]